MAEAKSVAASAQGEGRATHDAEWPAPVAEIVLLGESRLATYQDARYAALYRERVDRVLAIERRSDPAATRGFALTRESARFLALWMAFDDIVRVAALKVRASRFARVRDEVAAAPGDVVRIVDYFKPGVPEFAGLLPRAVAAPAAAMGCAGDRRGDARRCRSRCICAATAFSGLALLRALAGLKRLRRHGARYAGGTGGHRALDSSRS